MFLIDFTPGAADDLEALRKSDQQRLVAEIEAQLAHDATTQTRNRKRLRPNRLAEWELRVGAFRVFYEVFAESDPAAVRIVAIGTKVGSDLFIHGERFEL